MSYVLSKKTVSTAKGVGVSSEKYPKLHLVDVMSDTCRDKRISRHVRNREISNSPRQIAIFYVFRDRSRNFPFSATNRDFFSPPRKIAHFPLNLKTKFAHFPLNLRTKFAHFPLNLRTKFAYFP